MNNTFRGCLVMILMLILACQPDSNDSMEIKEETEIIPSTLPFSKLTLNNLSDFQKPPANWSICGSVFSDWKKENDIVQVEGKGVLVNLPSENESADLLTNWNHGDLDLELEFLLPKASNSGIYLQGRYEIQLIDSWGREVASSGDCGGIYERWDDTKPEGQKGFDGHPPHVNACKAPGLWQQLKIAFQAARFNEEGQKIQNAILKEVYLNGYLIHENVELSGPTRGALTNTEVPTGPLRIQGDHGPIAFRNIKYKAYSLDQLKLNNITYEFYTGKDDKLPDFSKLTPQKSGVLDSIDIFKASEQADGYRLKFKGQLEVPVSGDYLFWTRIDDGGELFIDGKSVVYNVGEPGFGIERGLINLTQGIHDFEVTYFQEVWGRSLVVDYEGPGMMKQSLASKMPKNPWRKEKPPILMAEPTKSEMIRGFVMHDGKKRTNVLSVGNPNGVHYSYDLRVPNLIKVWKGDFADLTEMWQDRGEAQLLKPMNAALDLSDGLFIAQLRNETSNWPTFVPDDFKFLGYQVDNNNQPSFNLKYKNTQFIDSISSASDGKSIKRTIKKIGEGANFYIRLAVGDQISKLPNGLYTVNGQYYIEGENLMIRNGKELICKMEDVVTYTIHW